MHRRADERQAVLIRGDDVGHAVGVEHALIHIVRSVKRVAGVGDLAGGAADGFAKGGELSRTTKIQPDRKAPDQIAEARVPLTMSLTAVYTTVGRS